FEVPYFNDFVHFKGLDREKGTLRIEADQKHRKDEYLLKLDEPLAIAFDYIDTTPSSRRLGKATLVLRKMRNSMDSLSGKVRFAFEEWANGRRLDWDCEELKNPVSDIQRHELVELKDGDAYGVFMLDKESGYCLIYHFPQDENGDKTAFHLLKLDEEFRRVESFSESGSKIDLILKIDYLSS
ncbi:MAG: hypothetical protein J5736_05630, partial [Bacilli bacterium]|nr:hypothetical protein [Bacilli bacterium]